MAVRQEKRAKEMRSIYLASNDSHEKAVLMGWESDEAIVGISAVAFALDGLYGDLQGVIAIPQTGKNRGRRRGKVYETLKRSTSQTQLASTWHEQITRLYSLRDQAVHHVPKFSSLVMHPIGDTSTSPEGAEYTAEELDNSVDLLLTILESVVKQPSRAAQQWATTVGGTVGKLREMRLTGEGF